MLFSSSRFEERLPAFARRREYMSCFDPVSFEAEAAFVCFDFDNDCAPRRSLGVFYCHKLALGGMEPTGVLHSELCPDLAIKESL